MTREERSLLGALALGIIPYALAFGLTAGAAGLGPSTATAMSLVVYAGASQFSAVAVLAAGGSAAVAVLTVWLVNLRFVMLGLVMPNSLTPTLRSRLLAAHLLIDPSLALAHATTPERRTRLFWIASWMIYVLWAVWTAIGVSIGTLIPDPRLLGLDAALPAVFVALLAPLWRDAASRRAAIGGASLSGATLVLASPTLAIPVGILGAGFGLIGRPAGSHDTEQRR